MKTQNIIRILAGLNFLIFFCPFFQTCSDKSMMKQMKQEASEVEQESLKDTVIPEIKHPETNTLQRTVDIYDPEKYPHLDEDRKKVTYNGYEMGYYIFNSKAEFEFEDLFDVTSYAFLSFTLILIFSAFILFLSFTDKYKIITILCIINIVLAIGSMVVFYFDGILEVREQIKFGYYLFLMNSILIIAYCNRIRLQNAI